jgi:hypothetical protein
MPDAPKLALSYQFGTHPTLSSYFGIHGAALSGIN